MPFVAAIGLSAFLLFSLELLAGRLLLPVFGGAPSVWTTALVFFTAVLLAGYAYADFAATRLTRGTQIRLQLVLVAVAIVLTLLAPVDVGVTRIRDLAEAANVLLALAVVVGPAALLLATTTPLVSAWYAGQGRDPWWLYAASNAASFAALLCYPLVIQPLIGLTAQRGLIVAGLLVYAGLLVAISFSRAPATSAQGAAIDDGAPEVSAGAPRELPKRRQLVWLLAAAVPAGLLAATTNFIQTDLVAAPLLWIGPLGAYLASFVVAFSPRAGRLIRLSEMLVPGAMVLLLIPFVVPVGWPIVPLIAVELGSLFVLAVAVHGRLAADRPDERQLTRFYLILAAGGVVGTASVALLAPLVFNSIYEYPLLVVAVPAALIALPAAGSAVTAGSRRLLDLRPLLVRAGSFAIVGGILIYGVYAQGSEAASALAGLFVIAGIIVALSARPPIALLATTTLFGALIVATYTNPLHRERTFFGVLEVRGTPEEHALYSGTTLHGLQFLDERRTMATTYFLPTGPFGDCISDLRSRTAGGARIAVAGLGAGVMATYVESGDTLTFIEIDAADVRIAQDPAYFTYLSDAQEPVPVIVGDGRLELAAMPAQSLDLLILDAFTSDTVPAHLLTAEAIATYLEKLSPGGVACFQLSNRYYDLPPAVASTAGSLGLDAVERVGQPSEQEKTDLGAEVSFWLVVGHAPDVARFEQAGWTRPPPGIVLTDDYADVTRLLFAGPRQR